MNLRISLIFSKLNIFLLNLFLMTCKGMFKKRFIEAYTKMNLGNIITGGIRV